MDAYLSGDANLSGEPIHKIIEVVTASKGKQKLARVINLTIRGFVRERSMKCKDFYFFGA